MECLRKVVWERPKGIPLVTVSNHVSCIDDPAIPSLIPGALRGAFSSDRVRWIPAAKEICFKNRLLSAYFSRGHLVPVIRGNGVYQRGMDWCLKLLNEGRWVHVFPEGKVNLTGECMRLKWGVGRLIAEARTTPVVVPFWHIGMDEILPNRTPYIPQLFKKLTVLVGDPIDFSTLVEHQREIRASAVMMRKQITDTLQDKLKELRTRAEVLHNSWNTDSLVDFRTL